MKTHDLKLDIKYFDDVKSGKKNFEIRKNDRDFQVGDILELKKVSWFLKFIVPIRYAISIMTNRRLTYLDKNDVPCVESKADTITAKVTTIVEADRFNKIAEIENGKQQKILNIQKVIKDYFSTDRLPNGYVVLGIEVENGNN